MRRQKILYIHIILVIIDSATNGPHTWGWGFSQHSRSDLYLHTWRVHRFRGGSSKRNYLLKQWLLVSLAFGSLVGNTDRLLGARYE